MKKLLIILSLGVLLVTGCAKQTPVQIVATTLPVYEFTSILCEETGLSVTRLITESVSCIHEYSLSVAQMQTIASAQVVILSGAGLEDFLGNALADANRIIDASSEIDFFKPHTHEHEHDSNHHHEHDPHIWLSPQKSIQMSKTIAKELSAIYPEYTEIFASNLQILLTKLNTLQEYGETTLRNLSSRELITFHDGFTYFADSFHLHILKAVEEESGSEASARELIEFIQLVETYNLPAIFTETNGSTGAAEIIASETGTSIYSLDMAMAGSSYFDAMYHNIDVIKEALE